jgi:hypothetical protein
VETFLEDQDMRLWTAGHPHHSCTLPVFIRVLYLIGSIFNWEHSILIYIQQDATLHFTLSANCSTCFGWYHHPSSGA